MRTKALFLAIILLMTSMILPISLTNPGANDHQGLILTSVNDFQLSQVFASHQVYWGSLQSNKFHYPWCIWAKRIKSSNLIIFKSRKEALDMGYIPCKVCKP